MKSENSIERMEKKIYFQAKEEEIKQLLSRADSYAAENQAEATVYSAMSDTLAEAWRDLNDKLDYRRRLLAESVTFHQKANSVSFVFSF